MYFRKRISVYMYYLLVTIFCVSTATRKDISQVLESEPQLTDLVLSNAMLCSKHVQPLFKALQRHNGLVKIILPGNKLGT